MASDSFSGTGALGANWIGISTTYPKTALEQSGGCCRGTGDYARGGAYYDASSADESQITCMPVASGAASSYIKKHTMVRSDANVRGYEVYYFGASGDTCTQAGVSGNDNGIALRTLTTAVDITAVNGNVLKITCSGVDPVTIKLYSNGVQAGADVSDATYHIAAAHPGIILNEITLQTNSLIDDWTDNVSAGATANAKAGGRITSKANASIGRRVNAKAGVRAVCRASCSIGRRCNAKAGVRATDTSKDSVGRRCNAKAGVHITDTSVSRMGRRCNANAGIRIICITDADVVPFVPSTLRTADAKAGVRATSYAVCRVGRICNARAGVRATSYSVDRLGRICNAWTKVHATDHSVDRMGRICNALAGVNAHSYTYMAGAGATQLDRIEQLLYVVMAIKS